MLKLNENPTGAIGEEISEGELAPKELAKMVKEDDKAWWIKHNGKYLLYCEKSLGVEHMRNSFNEVVMRFTNAAIPDALEYSASSYHV